MFYQSTEKNSNIRIAEGDPFTLRCRVGYSSNLVSGRWAPELRWYNHNNDLISSSTVNEGSHLVRRDTIPVTAAEAMHGKNFRCHTAFEATQGNVGDNSTNHLYSSTPPTYTEDKTVMISVDRKFTFTWFYDGKCYLLTILKIKFAYKCII